MIVLAPAKTDVSPEQVGDASSGTRFAEVLRLLSESRHRDILCEDAIVNRRLSSRRATMNEREEQWTELMRAANRGSKSSYSRLLTALASSLPRIVAPSLARLGLPKSDVEDVVQEVLLAIHSKRHTWDESRPLMPWLRAIIRHKVLDIARQRHRQAEAAVASALDAVEVMEPAEELPSMQFVQRHVDELPKQQRNVVKALVLDGATIQETAEKLNLSRNAVYVTLHRAVKGLITRFGRETQ
jgi:RNA polymerase sigma-70 factor (ECF subfamily)